jgi:hypothetical protein
MENLKAIVAAVHEGYSKRGVPKVPKVS